VNAISIVVMFQAQNRETINRTLKVAVSFKIIMTTSVTRPCFTKRHQNCKTKTKTDYFGLRPVLSKDRWSQTTSLIRERQKALTRIWLIF